MRGRLTPGQAVLRVLILLGPLLALLASGIAGERPPGWLVALVLALALGFAAMPDSPLGTAAMLVVVAWSGLTFRDGLPPEAVLAASGLLVAHVAAVLASYGPGDLPLDRHLARLWAVRGLAVLARADLPLEPRSWPNGLRETCPGWLTHAALPGSSDALATVDDFLSGAAETINGLVAE